MTFSRPFPITLVAASLLLAGEGAQGAAAQLPPPAPPAAPAPPPAPPAAPGAPRWQSAEPRAKDREPPRRSRSCVDAVTDDPAMDRVLRGLAFTSGDQPRPLGPPRIVGLRTIDENELWKLLGGKPPHPDVAQMAVLLRRLVGLEIFERVSPVVRLAADGTPSLEVTVEEQPAVRKIVFEGLEDSRPERLLEALLEIPGVEGGPARFFSEDDGDEREQGGDQAQAGGGAGAAAEPTEEERAALPRCRDPLPRQEWLARAEGEVVHPGIVWRGLRPGLQRVVSQLYDRGYEMASLSGELAADGTLTVRIDEGRVSAIEIRGVAPALEPKVRARLELAAGRTFVAAELESALHRVKAVFPFVRADHQERLTRAAPLIVEQPAPGGVRRYHATEPSPAAAGADRDPFPRAVARAALRLGIPEELVDAAYAMPVRTTRWYTVEGRTLVIHLRTQRGHVDLSWEEIIRHTPVTGFAPGLELLGRVWDREDRAHLTVDLAANVNTHRATRAAAAPPPGAMSPEAERWRFDWLAGGRVQVPAIAIAELGAQGYSRVETADRWRIDRVDSYLYSLIFNRPDSEYFRRDGLSAFITAHLLERLTAGLEYRRDRYRSLESFADAFTVFDRASPSRPTPAIDEGTMASIVVRLEWSSERASPLAVGGPWRDPERSLVNRRWHEEDWCRLSTVNTLEVADPSLGGDAGFAFVRMVSDSTACARLSRDHGFKVRFRAAGRVGNDPLPAQREEALGGWSALRGYDFKELRDGDFSLLGTVEYRVSAVSVFLDAGSVSAAGGGFGPVRTGLGVSLNFGEEAHLAFAWRTDNRARLRPELRLLFHRTF